MNTPSVNLDPSKLSNSNFPNNLQDILKKDFSTFFLGNQNPLVTLVHGIQLIRFSLLMFQKESNKPAENMIIPQEKRVVNMKDFNSLLYENNFQDLQLSFFNPLKNDAFLLNPMTELELSHFEMNIETQNALLNLSKFNIVAPSNFLSMPQNFSPFPMNPLISPNFTPIINRGHPTYAGPNLMNVNNLIGFNSNFSSPAVNFNYYPPNSNDFFLTRILEMNSNKISEKTNNYNSINNNNSSNNSANFINNNNNMSQNNQSINVKMEVDEENSLLKKRS